MKKVVKKKEISKRDRYTIVLEDLNSKIGLLVDGQKMADEKFDRFKTETEDNFQSIRSDLGNFKVEIEKNFKVVFKYLSRTDDRIENIENELRSIKAEIKGLKMVFNDKVGLERVIALEQKVSILEKLLMKKKILVKV